MDKKRALAGIKLLDDPDESVYRAVKKSLMDEGREVIPLLEKEWEGSLSPLLQGRIEDIVKSINTFSVHADLRHWIDNEDQDLVKGAWIIARINYPDLELEELDSKIKKIASEIWLEFNDNLTALEKVRILNHIFFKEKNFYPNTTNFFAPQNGMINLALETGKCNPVMLGIIYIAVASELEMPVYGVNLPNNFILAYLDPFTAAMVFGDETDNQVLFYINPFNRGAVFGRKVIDQFLTHSKSEPDSRYYLPCKPSEIINKLCETLFIAYNKNGYADKANELNELIKIIEQGSC